jgi:hypothetical protein
MSEARLRLDLVRLAKNGEAGNAAVEMAVKEKVHALTRLFPIY